MIDTSEPVPIGELLFLGRKFEWSKNLLEPEKVRNQFQAFTKTHPEIAISAQETVNTITTSNKMAAEIYERFCPAEYLNLVYHNADHEAVTGLTGLKLFLGGLVKLADKPEYKEYFGDRQKVGKLITTVAFCLANHEVDDWFDRMDENFNQEQIEQKQAVIADGKAKVRELLEVQKINPWDFQGLVSLDAFSEPVEVSLKKATDTPQAIRDFLEVGRQSQSEVLADLVSDKGLRQEILRVYANSVRAADFMQIFNPAYRQEIQVRGEDGQVLRKTAGTIALATEVIKFRPKMISGAGWSKNGDGVLDWGKVGMDAGFYLKLAKPNIELGLNYMRNFDAGEYDRAMGVKGEYDNRFGAS